MNTGLVHDTTRVPTIHCDEMALNNTLFHQCVVTSFPEKENNSTADICGDYIMHTKTCAQAS